MSSRIHPGQAPGSGGGALIPYHVRLRESDWFSRISAGCRLGGATVQIQAICYQRRAGDPPESVNCAAVSWHLVLSSRLAFRILRTNLSDDPGWNPHSEAVGWDILGHDSARPDHGSFVDRDSRQQNTPGAYP